MDIVERQFTLSAAARTRAGIYHYDEYDREFLRDRVAEFRGQVERRLAGALTEDEFKPLRLMNGLYLQLHAYMLRCAIPYGVLSSDQLRQLAHIARTYDRGFGHFTTRLNLTSKQRPKFGPDRSGGGGDRQSEKDHCPNAERRSEVATLTENIGEFV